MTLALIVVTTLIRIGFGWALGLGVDESYMVASGRVLRLGYFDHPPAAWWLQWGAAHLFGTEAPLAVRAPFILCFALSTWLMFRLAAEVADERAGFWAALTLNLSPVFGVTTGTWVLPDGPLDAALLGAALCLMRALPARGTVAWGWWLGSGACAGLALFSKYTACLTIGGAVLFLAVNPTQRRWLTRPAPYAAALLAGAIFAPVLVWNATHHWASFAFQGARAGGLHFRPWAFVVILAGEALFVLPWLWAAMMASTVKAIMSRDRGWRIDLLICLAAPPILGFALVGVWSGQRVLFHWAAPGYLMLFPILGAAIADRENLPWVRRSISGTAALVVAVVLFISVQVRFGLLEAAIASVARHNPDLEAVDWTSLRSELSARGLLSAGTLIAVPDWRSTGKIAYGLGPGVTVICLDPDARQFGLVAPASEFRGRSMLVLAPEHPDRIARDLDPRFGRLTPRAPLGIRQNGEQIGEVSVFAGSGFKG